MTVSLWCQAGPPYSQQPRRRLPSGPRGQQRNETMNSLINILTKSGLLTKDLDYHLYQVSETLTPAADSRIGIYLIHHGKQLREVCHVYSGSASLCWPLVRFVRGTSHKAHDGYSPTCRRRSKDRNNRRACSGRKVLGHIAPLAPRAQHVHDPIHNFAHIDLALAATMFHSIQLLFGRTVKDSGIKN